MRGQVEARPLYSPRFPVNLSLGGPRAGQGEDLLPITEIKPRTFQPTARCPYVCRSVMWGRENMAVW